MSLKEMAKLTKAELYQREKVVRKELMDMRFEHAVGKLINTAAPKEKRKELAQLLTLLNVKANNQTSEFEAKNG